MSQTLTQYQDIRPPVIGLEIRNQKLYTISVPLSRNQIIILAGIGLLVLVVGGLFIFGGRKTEKVPEVDLVVWGVEDRNAMNNVLGNYMGARGNVSVKYQQMDPATYEDALLNALAAGRGPDVFAF